MAARSSTTRCFFPCIVFHFLIVSSLESDFFDFFIPLVDFAMLLLEIPHQPMEMTALAAVTSRKIVYRGIRIWILLVS